MTIVKYVKIREAIEILNSMLEEGVEFSDIIAQDERTIYFTHSEMPTKHEIIGNGIIKSLNLEHEEEK